jgi:DNA processing protein
MHEETRFALALTLIPGLGTKRLHKLIRHYGLPSRVFRLGNAELKRLRLCAEIRASLLSGRALNVAERELEKAAQKGIRTISPFEEVYPENLREIFDPPLALYCLGDVDLLSSPTLAIVGSRRCSIYGREVTLRLSRELAVRGLTIVSGMARGIDSQAHVGALSANGSTVAVLGSGVDVVYPRENRALYQKIASRGCIVSEFPCGSFPAPQNFPVRNRIISGLSWGTVISEASEFSGSLITARLTLEQNREVWAVPGNITSKGSYGPNYLIKQGAHVVLDTQDVFDQLPISLLGRLQAKASRQTPGSEFGEQNTRDVAHPDRDELLSLLPVDRGCHFDEILETSGLPLAELNQRLLELEMKGLVRQMPGRKFSRRL